MLRLFLALLIAFASAAAVAVQSPGTCSPPGTPKCDPNGVPVPGEGGGGATGGNTTVTVVNAVVSTIPLGGGRAVKGAEGIALDPSTGREVAAVGTGQAPIWPTVDPNRRVVYMAGSGGAGTISVHN